MTDHLTKSPSGGLCSEISRITFFDSEALTYQKLGGAVFADIPGILWIDVPEHLLVDNSCNEAFVVTVELQEPLRLYRGKGKVIDQN